MMTDIHAAIESDGCPKRGSSGGGKPFFREFLFVKAQRPPTSGWACRFEVADRRAQKTLWEYWKNDAFSVVV